MIAAALSAIASRKHLSRMHERGIEQAASHRDVALEPMLRIEDGDVKLLHRKILQPLREDLVHVARPSDRRAFLARLGRHSPAQLERGVDTNRTSRSNSPHARERCDRLRRQQPERPSASGKNFLPDSYRRFPFRSASQQDRDQLTRAECLRSVCSQSLTRPLGGRKLAYRGCHSSLSVAGFAKSEPAAGGLAHHRPAGEIVVCV